jgi:hypothetical protein
VREEEGEKGTGKVEQNYSRVDENELDSFVVARALAHTSCDNPDAA